MCIRDSINESRSLIRVRQGKGKKDRYTLLSRPLMKKLTEYNKMCIRDRVYTSYFRDFQQHFEGRKIETVTPGEINDYLLYLCLLYTSQSPAGSRPGFVRP